MLALKQEAGMTDENLEIWERDIISNVEYYDAITTLDEMSQAIGTSPQALFVTQAVSLAHLAFRQQKPDGLRDHLAAKISSLEHLLKEWNP